MPRKKKELSETDIPTDRLETAPVSPRKARARGANASASPKRAAPRKKAPIIQQSQPEQAFAQAPVQVQEDLAAFVPDQIVEPAVAPELQECSVSEHEQIALLAYSFWEARGHRGGSPEEDWLRAEREYRRRREGNELPR